MRKLWRTFIAGGVYGCLACSTAALAEPLPMQLDPLLPPGYTPLDQDERGLWHSLTRMEEYVATSSILMDAPALQEYTLEILQRMLGPHAKDLRVYIIHDASFNATMAPNGMMTVHSGLLARVRNEAQYASILGHEAGHYLRKHSISGWRDHINKTGFMSVVSAGAAVMSGTGTQSGQGGSWADLANSINQSLYLSLFSFKREQESEADAYGIKLVSEAGYDTEAPAEVWHQVIEERKASAKELDKKYRDDSFYAYSTHPPSAQRMESLKETSHLLQQRHTGVVTDGKDRWDQIIAPYRMDLLNEQVKLNDAGASLYLINALAADGWTGILRYFEGEVYRLRGADGDEEKAAEAYGLAVTYDDAPPEAWRARGYALMKMEQADDGRRALKKYLELRPEAPDAPMVQFALGQ